MSTSSALREMYQQLIIEHAKKPHGFGLRDPFDAQAHQVNTSCGDEVTVRLAFDGVNSAQQRTADTVLTDFSWEGAGCSISMASTSVLSGLITGKSIAEVQELSRLFKELMHSQGKGIADEDLEELGDAEAFIGVAQYPMRVKCAMLGWTTLTKALAS